MTIAGLGKAIEGDRAVEALLFGATGLKEALEGTPIEEEDLQQEIKLARLTGEPVKSFKERVARKTIS